LEVVAERLPGIEVLGDGVIGRVLRQTEAEFFRAPTLARATKLAQMPGVGALTQKWRAACAMTRAVLLAAGPCVG
jgi:hypothetical protein